jgi:hypothetical protein
MFELRYRGKEASINITHISKHYKTIEYMVNKSLYRHDIVITIMVYALDHYTA